MVVVAGGARRRRRRVEGVVAGGQITGRSGGREKRRERRGLGSYRHRRPRRHPRRECSGATAATTVVVAAAVLTAVTGMEEEMGKKKEGRWRKMELTCGSHVQGLPNQPTLTGQPTSSTSPSFSQLGLLRIPSKGSKAHEEASGRHRLLPLLLRVSDESRRGAPRRRIRGNPRTASSWARSSARTTYGATREDANHERSSAWAATPIIDMPPASKAGTGVLGSTEDTHALRQPDSDGEAADSDPAQACVAPPGHRHVGPTPLLAHAGWGRERRPFIPGCGEWAELTGPALISRRGGWWVEETAAARAWSRVGTDSGGFGFSKRLLCTIGANTVYQIYLFDKRRGRLTTRDDGR
uniref:Uncharacterized protein n=1 Tax=Oryza punctata TaxID=4537 RepID=A0A0E0LEB9_ORYPU